MGGTLCCCCPGCCCAKSDCCGSGSSASTCCDILKAIIFPPSNFEISSSQFWICLLLTALGYLPGNIYSIYYVIYPEK
ncbi:hypothetical protein SUGI_0840270 [Cryptomeria japonica]|nr:hypothetical protein SUGI_0840270 [Cryptomeria japonica]